LADNLGRIYLFYAKSGEVEFEQILSVFVCSHLPQDLVGWFATKGIEPRQTGQEWRLHYQIGLININIIVCRLLPLEERYYQLLLFAPATSPKWKEFVKIAIEQELKELVNLATRLKPLEVSMVIEERQKDNKLTASQIAIYKKAGENVLSFIKSLPLEQQIDFFANVYTMEEFLTLEKLFLSDKLSLEQRLAGFSREERKKLLELLLQEEGETENN
jgi:hypothetical protein